MEPLLHICCLQSLCLNHLTRKLHKNSEDYIEEYGLAASACNFPAILVPGSNELMSVNPDVNAVVTAD